MVLEEIVKGKVTGITKFGAFVSIEGGKNGMVHISEIADGFVKDINDHIHIGDEVEAMVVSIDENGRIGLSIKKCLALKARTAPPPMFDEGVPAPDTDFENMMKRFKAVSNDKQADIKRGFESKRGTGKRGRK